MSTKLTAWVSLAALAMYAWTFVNVARARVKHQVSAPSVDGPLAFQSALRVQMNTVEQMMLFFPALWLCAIYLGDLWAAAGGAAWVLGRVMYALAYYDDPAKRGPGFTLSLVASGLLLLGAGFGLLFK